MNYRSLIGGALLGLTAAVAIGGTIASAAAQEKEIAVMLPAAGDPYF